MHQFDIRLIARMSIFITIICVSAFINIPIGEISFTLQTLVVILSALFLKEKSVFVIIFYIIIGLLGIPVFSRGGGLDYVFKLSFGFILSFIPMCLIIGLTAKKTKKPLFLLLSIFIATMICYIIGISYMALVGHFYYQYPNGLETYLAWGFYPFIIPDLIKGIVAYIIYERIGHLVESKKLE